MIIDSSVKLEKEDYQLFELLEGKKVLVVKNKNDLENKVENNEIPFSNIINISAKYKEVIIQLKQRLFDMVIDENIMQSNVIITNSRHVNALDRAIESMQQVINSLQFGDALELITVDINNVWLALGEITGETNNEEIINNSDLAVYIKVDGEKVLIAPHTAYKI